MKIFILMNNKYSHPKHSATATDKNFQPLERRTRKTAEEIARCRVDFDGDYLIKRRKPGMARNS